MPTRSTKHSLEFICSFNHSIEKSLITMSFNQLRQSTNQPIINHDQPMNLSAHFQFTEFLAFFSHNLCRIMNQRMNEWWLSITSQSNKLNFSTIHCIILSCWRSSFQPFLTHFSTVYSPNVRSYININSALVSFLDDLYDSNDVYDCTHIFHCSYLI